MRLNVLQGQLESIYEVRSGPRIEDFLTTDQNFAATATQSPRLAREQILLQEEGDDLWLSLYLDPDIYASLDRHPAPESMCQAQASEFCMAVEGVSHFLYLCWNANFQREVTQLELELQAEVDKYLLLSNCVAAEWREQLHPWLFEQWQFEEHLNEEQQLRYEDANRYAGKYCRTLEQRFLRIGKQKQMVKELRRFYRKTQTQKIRMIDGLNVG